MTIHEDTHEAIIPKETFILCFQHSLSSIPTVLQGLYTLGIYISHEKLTLRVKLICLIFKGLFSLRIEMLVDCHQVKPSAKIFPL